MRALVTRPLADAGPLAEALAARGFEVMVEPMLDIVPLEGVVLSFEGVQGILATSANGIRALAANTERRDLPIWAVGPATAAAARQLGFSRVDEGHGDVVALADLVIAYADREAGALLHVAGSHLAGDLSARLEAQGFNVRRAVLYEARAAQVLSAELRDRLAARQIDIALFFSPRTAKTFVTLVTEAGLGGVCRSISVFALSPAVARELDSLVWRSMWIGAGMSGQGILDVLDRHSEWWQKS
jgi:uroporphyrinogen-III synthase